MNSILIAFLTILSFSMVNAQETTVLLKGIVTDRLTGNHVFLWL